MWNHVEITLLHGFHIFCALRLCEALSVMCEAQSVMHHDCNHDSCVIAMMS